MHSKYMYTCLLTLQVSLSVQAIEFQGGEWELTVKQMVNGMPVSREATIYRECLTPTNPIPTSYLRAQRCDVLEQRDRHRTVFYKMSCYTDNGSLINEGQVRFGSFKITGDSKSELGQVAGRPMVMQYKFEGRRLGECD